MRRGGSAAMAAKSKSPTLRPAGTACGRSVPREPAVRKRGPSPFFKGGSIGGRSEVGGARESVPPLQKGRRPTSDRCRAKPQRRGFALSRSYPSNPAALRSCAKRRRTRACSSSIAVISAPTRNTTAQ
ncbi:hypothetical protein [Lysobacter gummosus]|uniref:hypothetical protein n=1 Tax=Lysobacter gummosus TaxID=262324 RepID=UPI0036336849